MFSSSHDQNASLLKASRGLTPNKSCCAVGASMLVDIQILVLLWLKQDHCGSRCLWMAISAWSTVTVTYSYTTPLSVSFAPTYRLGSVNAMGLTKEKTCLRTACKVESQEWRMKDEMSCTRFNLASWHGQMITLNEVAWPLTDTRASKEIPDLNPTRPRQLLQTELDMVTCDTNSDEEGSSTSIWRLC